MGFDAIQLKIRASKTGERCSIQRPKPTEDQPDDANQSIVVRSVC